MKHVVFPHHPQQHTALAHWKLGWPCLRKGRGLPVPQTQNNAPLSLPRTGDITRGNASCLSAVTRATLPPLRDPAGRRSPSPKPRSRGKREPRRLALSLGVNNLPRHSPGKTALHWAAAVNNARAAHSLLQAGADKDAQDGRVRPGRGLPTKKKTVPERGGKRRKPPKPEGGGAESQVGGVTKGQPCGRGLP